MSQCTITAKIAELKSFTQKIAGITWQSRRSTWAGQRPSRKTGGSGHSLRTAGKCPGGEPLASLRQGRQRHSLPSAGVCPPAVGEGLGAMNCPMEGKGLSVRSKHRGCDTTPAVSKSRRRHSAARPGGGRTSGSRASCLPGVVSPPQNSQGKSPGTPNKTQKGRSGATWRFQ